MDEGLKCHVVWSASRPGESSPGNIMYRVPENHSVVRQPSHRCLVSRFVAMRWPEPALLHHFRHFPGPLWSPLAQLAPAPQVSAVTLPTVPATARPASGPLRVEASAAKKEPGIQEEDQRLWPGQLLPPVTSIVLGTWETLMGPHTQLQCPLTVPGGVVPTLSLEEATGSGSRELRSAPQEGHLATICKKQRTCRLEHLQARAHGSRAEHAASVPMASGLWAVHGLLTHRASATVQASWLCPSRKCLGDRLPRDLSSI